MVYGLEWLIGPPTPKAQPVREKSKDGGYVAPDRGARERCYESRDIFFECLDKHDILDANKHDEESRQKCPGEVAGYERDCAKSWVSSGRWLILESCAEDPRSEEYANAWLARQIKYFKEKRVMEYNRDMTIDKIKKDDAELVAKLKAQKKKSGGGGWFS